MTPTEHDLSCVQRLTFDVFTQWPAVFYLHLDVFWTLLFGYLFSFTNYRTIQSGRNSSMTCSRSCRREVSLKLCSRAALTHCSDRPPPIASHRRSWGMWPYQCPQLTCLSRVCLFRVRLATAVTTNRKQRALVSAHKPTITDALPISCLITLCCLSIISQSHHTVIHNAPLGVINNINRRILNQW